MAALPPRKTGMSLQAMQQYGGRRFLQRDDAVWTGEIGADWSARTQDLALMDTFASVADLVEFEDTVEVGGN